MVRIIDFKERKNAQNESFFTLILTGGLEIVKSKETGRRYATQRQASMPSTFDENTCKTLIGSELPGTISKVPCEEYSYTVHETGEIIQLSHHWEYTEQSENVEEVVFQKEMMEEVTI